MSRFVTVCSLLIGLALMAVVWLFPGSIITWFTGSDQPFLLMKSGIAAALLVLLAAEAYVDSAPVRRVAGIVALGMTYGAWRLLLEYPVYVLDVLFMLSAAVCFGLTAMQAGAEDRKLPAEPKLATAQRAQSLFVGLRRRLAQRQPVARFQYLNYIRDDSHSLTINMPRA
jgi:hypothetical protein